jgi:hypothetical protein
MSNVAQHAAAGRGDCAPNPNAQRAIDGPGVNGCDVQHCGARYSIATILRMGAGSAAPRASAGVSQR